MKSKERFKILILIFTFVANARCDFFVEMMKSLQILQDTVDKISLEQIRTNEKVDKLQNEVKSLSLDMNSKLETLDDLYEANNNKTFEAIDQLKIQIETFSMESKTHK